MGLEKIVKNLDYSAVIGLAFASGCISNGIKSRIGSYASATVATDFQGLKDLRTHGSAFEGRGQVYTCKAGHIDMAHLRKSADWTKYFADESFKHLIKEDEEFCFKMKEPSMYFVKLDYPKNWNNLFQEEKETAAKDISIKLGQYFSYTGVTWHEMLTWFGYKSTGFYPEFPSAFTWEDSFSNFLGVYLAGKALKDNNPDFNKSMTLILEKELISLGIQSSAVSRKASEKVRGKWYSGDFLFVDMKKRNFNIGLNGFIVPWLVPGIDECRGIEPQKIFPS